MAQLRKPTRLIAAAAALGFTLTALMAAAQAGEVRLGAGDVELVMGSKEGAAVALQIGERTCPPECDFLAIGFERAGAAANATIFRSL